MKDYVSVKISSRYTRLSYAGIVLLSVIMVPVLLLLLSGFELKPNALLGFLLLAAALSLLVFCALYLAEARIENNKFYLKKFLRPERVYDAGALCGLKTFDVGKDHYIIFTLKDGAAKERFLVYTSRHIFYRHEKLNSETILREILEENQKNGLIP